MATMVSTAPRPLPMQLVRRCRILTLLGCAAPPLATTNSDAGQEYNPLPVACEESVMTITPEHISAFAIPITALSGLVWSLRRKR